MNIFFNRKNVLLIAFIATLVWLLSAFQKEIGFCGPIYNDCWDIIDLVWPPLTIFLPLFLLSLFAFFMREEIFATWVNFAKWWVPLSVFAILITPEKAGGFVSIPYQSALALIVTGVFFFISLILITWKWFALRKTK